MPVPPHPHVTHPAVPGSPLVDLKGRPLLDLRVSVTDRCNFRCAYCMPPDHFGPGFRFLPRRDVLSFKDIARLARLLGARGLRKVRLTGGEPLLRSDLPQLVRMLSEIPGLEVAMSTNGALLARHASALADAGLYRVNVSLDSLDDRVLQRITHTETRVRDVLAGIEAARAAGLTPIKVNTVVRRGENDDGIVDLARHFRWTGVVPRFIEYMDAGTTNGWQRSEVVEGSEIIERIGRLFPLEPVTRAPGGQIADRWRYLDGAGEIGVIASVTQPFCRDCTRLRLAADGRLYACLFASHGVNVREVLRSADDAALERLLDCVWSRRNDRYSERRWLEKTCESAPAPRVEMSLVGG